MLKHDYAARVNFESKCVTYLCALYKNDGGVERRAASSGFFYRHGGKVFLITCRHCITGRDENNAPLSATSFDPTHLQIYFRYRHDKVNEEASIYAHKGIEVCLWKDGAPQWKEHPEGGKIDVIAISLDAFPFDVACINDLKKYNGWKAEAGDECFVLGFPERLSGPDRTPIWKRASIATEPDIRHNDRPVFLIDSATRVGLSGAPVVARAIGFFDRNADGVQIGGSDPTFLGRWSFFLGIYSGRQGDESDGFQLGRVFHAELLEKIVTNHIQPNSPHSS